MNETLFEYHFKRVDFVTEPGEFSVRGGIVDVFSFSHDEPYRLEFFGDEIDSIRSFDVETQLSTDKHKKITLVPNVADKILHEARESFLKYISDRTLLFIKQPELCFAQLDKLFKKAGEAFTKLEGELAHAEGIVAVFVLGHGFSVRVRLRSYRNSASQQSQFRSGP